MTRHRRAARASPPHNAFAILSQRIEEFAEREGHYSNAEIIRLMRETYFADVEALQKSGAVILPE